MPPESLEWNMMTTIATTKDEPPKFYISYCQGSRYILCLTCKKPSYDPQDINAKRCPYCKKDHS